jgi:hypothetical protein
MYDRHLLSSDEETMYKFDYRSPRFSVDLPVQVTVQKSTLTGRCIEIGKEGMKLELQQPLPPDASGMVSISYQDQTLQLNVRVAHAGEIHGGVEFIYKSESERNAVAQLVASLSTPRNRLGPVLLN